MRWGSALAGFMISSAISGIAAAQPNPLAGTWLSTINPGKESVIYVTLVFAPNGQMSERFMNRLGIAYELLGTYRFDAASGALQFVFTDYAPRQLCSPLGCQSAPVPPNPLNVTNTAQITFPNPSQMIGKAADGSVMIWGRSG